VELSNKKLLAQTIGKSYEQKWAVRCAVVVLLWRRPRQALKPAQALSGAG